MRVYKELVESVSDRGKSMEEHDSENYSGHHAPHVTHAVRETGSNGARSTSAVCVDEPGDGMDNALGDDDTSTPSMQKVKGIERDSEKRDERIVPEREEYCGYEVESRELSTSTAKLGENGRATLTVPVEDETVSDVGEQIESEEKRVKARGECADTDGRRKLDLLVVTSAEEWGVQEVFFDTRPRAEVVHRPVALSFGAVECHEVSHVGIAHVCPSEE